MLSDVGSKHEGPIGVRRVLLLELCLPSLLFRFVDNQYGLLFGDNID